ILIEGDEGHAQIIPLHGALHRCVDSNDGATPRRLPHRISPRVRGEVDLRAERQRSEASRVRGRFRTVGLADTPPHPDSFAPLRFARNPTSPRTRGEVGASGAFWRSASLVLIMEPLAKRGAV